MIPVAVNARKFIREILRDSGCGNSNFGRKSFTDKLGCYATIALGAALENAFGKTEVREFFLSGLPLRGRRVRQELVFVDDGGHRHFAGRTSAFDSYDAAFAAHADAFRQRDFGRQR